MPRISPLQTCLVDTEIQPAAATRKPEGRETKDSSNSIEAIARNYLSSVWSPTERNDGVSPEKHPGSERWPLRAREPLSRLSEVGLGAVLFVRACRAIAYRMATPSWPVWEPTSFSDRGLEHNLSNPSVRVDSRNGFVQLAAPRRRRWVRRSE